MSSHQYQRYPASPSSSSSSPAPSRQPSYPGAYPSSSPSPLPSSSSYVPPPPPPPPTPPSVFSQSQYPPPPEEPLSAPSNPYRRGPGVFDRLSGRRNTNPPPVSTSTPAYAQQQRNAEPYSSHRLLYLQQQQLQQQQQQQLQQQQQQQQQQQHQQQGHQQNHQHQRHQPYLPGSFSSASSSVSSSASSASSHTSSSRRPQKGQQANPDVTRLREENSRRSTGRNKPNNIRISRSSLPPGYKPPTVESAPPSPATLVTLSPDSKHVLDEDEGYFSNLSAEAKARLRNEPLPDDVKPKLDPVSNPSPEKEKTRLTNKATEWIKPPLIKSDSWKRYPVQLVDNSVSDSEPNSPEEATTRNSRPYSLSTSSPSPASPTPPSTRQPRPYSIKPDTIDHPASIPRAPRHYPLKTDLPPPITRDPRPYNHSPSPQTRYQPPPLDLPLSSRPSPQPRYRQTPPPPQALPRPPPKREPAPPLELLPPCPKKTLVSWNKWFQIPGVPNFDVCIKCYYTHIHPTQFHAHFLHVDKPKGAEASCYFNTDRVLQKVLPQAKQSGNFNVFKEYASSRSTIPPCTGVEGTSTGGLSAKRWKVYDGSIRGFRCCDACYNDIIIATGFAGYFAPAHPQPEDKVWTCDLAIPFIAGGILQLSKYQDLTGQDQWDEFRKIALYRLHDVPSCPGETPVKGSGRKWWIPKNPIPGLYVCDACYCDDIVPHFKDEFVQAPLLPHQPQQPMLSCAMANFSVKGPWALAVENKSYQVWWEAAHAVFTLPRCTEKGFPDHVVGGEWFTLHHHDPNLEGFKACRTCYYTLLRPLNLAQHFEPVIYMSPADGSSVTRVCNLTPDSQRFLPLLDKLGEAANWKDFNIFLAYIIPRARIPPCQPGKFLARAKWYGTDDFVVCEECWFEHVRESPLAHLMTVHARYSPDPQACDLYSPRMKRIWDEACQAGDLDHFVDAAVDRGRIYCDILERSKEINDQIQQRKNRMVGNAVARVGEDGYGYGAAATRTGYDTGADLVMSELYKSLDLLQKEWKSVE